MNVTELPTHGKEANVTVLPDKSDAKQVVILIHTRNGLDESTAKHVIQKLNHMAGVSDIRYNPTKNHLLIVSYSPHAVKPVQLLAVMRTLGHEAQLVGL